MADSRKYLNPQTLAELQSLDLKARMIVEGYVSGMHKSPYHGFSIEFAEHREYVPGDDLRYVDWKVFGKHDRYYLKQFEEETNFSCQILLDTSESMQYQSEHAALSKLEYGKCVAAALAYLIIKQQDAVGLSTFHTELTRFLGASSHPAHFQEFIAVLDQAESAGDTSLGRIFHGVAERVRKRGLVIIISDFFDELDELALGLKHFKYRGHDVSLMQLVDPAEQDFPFDDPTLFRGLEHFPDEMADPRAIRRAYQQEFEQFRWNLERTARDMRMEYRFLRTDDNLGEALAFFLTSRMQRTRRV